MEPFNDEKGQSMSQWEKVSAIHKTSAQKKKKSDLQPIDIKLIQ